MKRIIVLVLALCMCLSLFACGKSEDVKAVEEAIATIGAVTADSGKSIAAARDMYDKLSDEDKAKVENISVLTDAEAAYEETVINAVANASALRPVCHTQVQYYKKDIHVDIYLYTSNMK